MGGFDSSASSSVSGKAATESLPCELCGSPMAAGEQRCPICGHASTRAEPKASTLPDWWKGVALGGVSVAVLLGFFLGPKDDVAPSSEPAEAATDTTVPETRPARRPVERTKRPIAAAPALKKEPEPQSAWKQQTEVSPLDDSKTIYFDLEADEAIQGPGGRIVTPVLSFVCAQGKLEAYVTTGVPVAPGRRRDFAVARIRFDKGEAEDVRMVRSTQDDALFFQKPISLVARILNNEEIVFGFTPAGLGLAVTTFRLFGLRAELHPFRAECGLEDVFVSESDDDGGQAAAVPDSI